MLELKTTSMQKSDESVLAVPAKRAPREHNQRRMMLVALVLLLVALVVVIYRDRDFWFPDSDDADDLQPVPATVTIQTQPSPATVNSTTTEKSAAVKAEKRHHAKTPAASVEQSTPTAPATSNARTVLPPLEVEVVAGDYHRQVHASPNSLQVDLQQGALPRKVSDTVSPDQNAAATTMNAAENLRISAEAAEVVSQPVRPGYPVLARQMKVQGSVILQALIGRDGLIQDLHVLTGPPILADAAEQAVRQWRFKPHYQNNQPVETQTSITVNFTISTN